MVMRMEYYWYRDRWIDQWARTFRTQAFLPCAATWLCQGPGAVHAARMAFSANWPCGNWRHKPTGKCTLLCLSAHTGIYSKWINVMNSKSINFNVKMKAMTLPEENRKIFSYSCGRQRLLKGVMHAKHTHTHTPTKKDIDKLNFTKTKHFNH